MAWTETDRLAVVVQDTAGYMHLFTSGEDVRSVELGLLSSTAGMTVTPLTGGVQAQIGRVTCDSTISLPLSTLTPRSPSAAASTLCMVGSFYAHRRISST